MRLMTIAATAALALTACPGGQALAHGGVKRDEARCVALQEVLNATRIEHEQMIAIAKDDKFYAPIARAAYERRARIIERITALCGNQWTIE